MKSKVSTIYRHFYKLSKYSLSSIVFKPILKSKFFDVNQRSLIQAYSYVYFKIFPTKFKPLCLHTGRARGALSNYYFSRITFKKFSIKGDIVGFRKSRW
jgi:ribosomal protein S14